MTKAIILAILFSASASVARADCYEVEIESCIATPADAEPECEIDTYMICSDEHDPLAGLDASGNFVATLDGV